MWNFMEVLSKENVGIMGSSLRWLEKDKLNEEVRKKRWEILEKHRKDWIKGLDLDVMKGN